MLSFNVEAQTPTNNWLRWSELPSLPDSLGLGGAFIGKSNGVLIVAGGSNFEKPTWAGGVKKFHSAIFILEKTIDGEYHWSRIGELPYAASNGTAVTTPEGILCMGGTNGVDDLDKVIRITWNAKERKVEIDENYPALPKGCAYLAATVSGDQVYVAGGRNAKHSDGMHTFWILNLRPPNGADLVWESLSAWPGPARSGAVLVTQHRGTRECVYLFSGKSGSTYLVDAYQYCPPTSGNEEKWVQKKDLPAPVMAAAATAFGRTHILCFSGSDGHDVDKIAVLRDQYKFSRTVLAYNTLDDTWTRAGEMPVGLVTSSAVWWDGKCVIPGGEIGPSRRTCQVFAAQPSMPVSE